MKDSHNNYHPEEKIPEVKNQTHTEVKSKVNGIMNDSNQNAGNVHVENQNHHGGAPSETTPLAISSIKDHQFARDVIAQFNQVIHCFINLRTLIQI